MGNDVELGDVLSSAFPGFASGADLPDGTLQVRMNNVTQEGEFDWSALRRVPTDAKQSQKYSVQPGDIMFNSTNSPELVGKAALFTGWREPVVFSNHFLRLRVDPTLADPRYIGWWLNHQWRQRRFERIATRWVNQAAVRKDDLLALRMHLPGLPEQARRADSLDAAARLRRARRRLLEESMTLRSARYLERFSGGTDQWSKFTIEDLAEERNGAIRTGPFGSQMLHSEFTDRGVAVLGIDNAVNNVFEWSERRYITEEKFTVLKRYQVFPGDILITIMATCGRCAIVPDAIGNAINTKHLCCISLDQGRCTPEYFQSAFLYHPFVRHQLEIATRGAIMDGLNMDIIKSLLIPVPSRHIQDEYGAFVTAQNRLVAVEREASRQAAHLFGALLRDTYSVAP